VNALFLTNDDQSDRMAGLCGRNESAVLLMCNSCSSNRQTEFGSEIFIHFSSLKDDLDKLPVMVFPRLSVCLDCGVVAEFTIPATELRMLRERSASAAA
jgi:hypothetical protein